MHLIKNIINWLCTIYNFSTILIVQKYSHTPKWGIRDDCNIYHIVIESRSS